GFGFGPPGGFGFGGPDGFDFGRGGGPGRQRARRGDIKFALLALIAEQPRHGYDLIKALEERYAGFYRPSPGSVYPTLQLLEDEGHVTSVAEAGKRIYEITEAGRAFLAQHEAEVREAAGGHRRQGRHREERVSLRQQVMALMASVQQVARHGTGEQIGQVRAIVENATKAVYAVLAGHAAPGDEAQDA
ncbi:MAG TPA: PadR family transcriptional regulator, partial [Herpetosiphonaceae bacterium]